MNVEPITDALLDDAARELIAKASRLRERRFILGIAGIGGAGKSTLAAKLLERITSATHHSFARLVPMDGFHFTNAVLDERGLRSRKGAPETFDAPAFIHLLEAARASLENSICFPIYDRGLHEPVTPGDAAHTILPATRLVITEGNYLLLDAPPWAALASVLDACWLLDTPIKMARDWIMARHMRGGRSAADAAAHYERTDLANARAVHERMRKADRVMRWA